MVYFFRKFKIFLIQSLQCSLQHSRMFACSKCCTMGCQSRFLARFSTLALQAAMTEIIWSTNALFYNLTMIYINLEPLYGSLKYHVRIVTTWCAYHQVWLFVCLLKLNSLSYTRDRIHMSVVIVDIVETSRYGHKFSKETNKGYLHEMTAWLGPAIDPRAAIKLPDVVWRVPSKRLLLLS